MEAFSILIKNQSGNPLRLTPKKINISYQSSPVYIFLSIPLVYWKVFVLLTNR